MTGTSPSLSYAESHAQHHQSPPPRLCNGTESGPRLKHLLLLGSAVEMAITGCWWAVAPASCLNTWSWQHGRAGWHLRPGGERVLRDADIVGALGDQGPQGEPQGKHV